MPKEQRLELSSPDEQLLPRELLLLYPVFALGLSALLSDRSTATGVHVAREIASMMLPFAALATTFHLLYRWLMPRALRLARVGWRQWTLHVSLCLLVAPTIAAILMPLHSVLCVRPATFARFATVCVLVSWAIVLPSVALQQWRRRVKNAERMLLAERRSTLEAQLSALQARTNPHFLFNSLNTVASLIPEDPALAERTLERLADLFRYALESTSMRMVPLAREVELVRDYLAIQSLRFGARLDARVDFDEAASDVQVPPLLLQPMVENAILHGLNDRPQARVRVRIDRVDARVLISVTDDGPGPGASLHRGTQSSVSTLRERLAQIYGDGGTLELAHAPGGGCDARVWVPVSA